MGALTSVNSTPSASRIFRRVRLQIRMNALQRTKTIKSQMQSTSLAISFGWRGKAAIKEEIAHYIQRRDEMISSSLVDRFRRKSVKSDPPAKWGRADLIAEWRP